MSEVKEDLTEWVQLEFPDKTLVSDQKLGDRIRSLIYKKYDGLKSQHYNFTREDWVAERKAEFDEPFDAFVEPTQTVEAMDCDDSDNEVKQ